MKIIRHDWDIHPEFLINSIDPCYAGMYGQTYSGVGFKIVTSDGKPFCVIHSTPMLEDETVCGAMKDVS